MKIQDLDSKCKTLREELSKIGGVDHNKSASKRIRLILGQLKNSIVELRRELVEMDKGE